jgi:alpha-glucosidase
MTLDVPPHDWWRGTLAYQIYPRSFADSDGDGMGDLAGITARLEHIRGLGADAVWLSPFYPSPQADAGYDVVDYRDVDPRFGTLADADELLARATELGLRVILDLVPNHSSDEHPWFQAALAAAPGSPERARYIFRDGRGSDGSAPPNNWPSVFGRRAWTRVVEADGRPGQWYLHLFDTKQPDWDWTSSQVRAEFESVLRFWLDRGVAGFRVDVAHGLVKAPGLPDVPPGVSTRPGLLDTGTRPTQPTNAVPFWDQDGVHEVYAGWRRVLDGYGSPQRILCAEAWVYPPGRMARYLRPGQMHQAFNFDFLTTPWEATALREVIDVSLGSAASVGASCTWVLSNHDVIRHASRLALPRSSVMGRWAPGSPPQPDRAVGLRRARAATTLMLALPGAAYLYQGEELGLPEVFDVPDEMRQDPAFRRTDGLDGKRDGCRTPMPWVADAPALGFSPSGRSWLPQPPAFAEYAVDRQSGAPGSTLELYRALGRARREHGLGFGTLAWADEPASAEVLAFVNGPVTVLANLGPTPLDVPEWARVLVRSGPLDQAGRVPQDTTAWLVAAD